MNRQTRFPNSLSTTVSTVDPYNFTTEYFFNIPGMKPGFQPDRDNKVTTTAVYLENRNRPGTRTAADNRAAARSALRWTSPIAAPSRPPARPHGPQLRAHHRTHGPGVGRGAWHEPVRAVRHRRPIRQQVF